MVWLIGKGVSKISATQYAQALARQKSLTDVEWLQRCDELAQQQPTLFFELLTFQRDGVSFPLVRSMVDYLSVLQFVVGQISPAISAPVSLPAFQAAIKRSHQLFQALETDDNAHFERMMNGWHESSVSNREPVVWAGCIEIMQQPEIMNHALFEGVVVTLYAIADEFSARLERA